MLLLYIIMIYYPLVNVYIAIENHHFIAGKIHELNGHGFNSKLLVITRGYGHYRYISGSIMFNSYVSHYQRVNPIKSH